MPSLFTAINLAEDLLPEANQGNTSAALEQSLRVLEILMEASVEFEPRAYAIAMLHNVLKQGAITYTDLSIRIGEDVANGIQLLTPAPHEQGLFLSSPSSFERIFLAANHYPELPAIALAVSIYELEQPPPQGCAHIDTCIVSAYECLIPRMEYHLLHLPAPMQSAFEALVYRLRFALMQEEKKVWYTIARHEQQTTLLRLRKYRFPAPKPRVVAHS